MVLTFVALLEIAESAGVVKMADFTSEANDATDTLDRQHQRRIGKADTTGVTLEEREEQLLLGDMPSTVTGRETVGMVPGEFVDAVL